MFWKRKEISLLYFLKEWLYEGNEGACREGRGKAGDIGGDVWVKCCKEARNEVGYDYVLWH